MRRHGFPATLGSPSNLRRRLAAVLDWAEAAQRWEVVRSGWPDRVLGYRRGVQALRELRQFDSAEAIAKVGAGLFPDDRPIAFERAMVAHVRHGWQAATQAWEDVRARFPELHQAYILGATALREVGQAAAAEELLVTAVQRFPDRPEVAIQFAIHPFRSQNWPEALRRLKSVRARFPQHPDGYAQGSWALMRAGDAQAAEHMIAEASMRFPTDPGVLTQSARIAMHRKDWPEALRRWHNAKALCPPTPQIDIEISRLSGLAVRASEPELQGRTAVANPRRCAC